MPATSLFHRRERDRKFNVLGQKPESSVLSIATWRPAHNTPYTRRVRSHTGVVSDEETLSITRRCDVYKIFIARDREESYVG
jgi:hypothetical protein